MPAYNFQLQFADKVKARIKRQTIRADRKDGYVPEPGAMFKAFTGLRSKKCRFLTESRISEVLPIVIKPEGIWLAGKLLDDAEANSIALLDGFEDADEMCRWFAKQHGPDFSGHLIRWL
jgi:hypothetical protein